MDDEAYLDSIQIAYDNVIVQTGVEADFLKLLSERRPCLYMREDSDSIPMIDCLLQSAIRDNRYNFAKELIAANADVNSKGSLGAFGGPLIRAADSSDIAMINLLLEHGARVNHHIQGRPGSWALHSAACAGKLENVKFLVEKGAIFNFVHGGGLSPLDHAKDPAVYEYLRSIGAKHGHELPRDHLPPPHKGADSLKEHLEKFFREVRVHPMHEIVPGDPPVRVLHVVDKYGQRLVTDGMSLKVQQVPEGDGVSNAATLRTELYFELHDLWPLDEAAMNDPRNRWPLDWLRKLAKWPFENHTYYRKLNIVANGEPPAPLADNTRLSCLMVAWKDDSWTTWTRPDGEVVRFMCVSPLYTEERDYELKHGTVEFLERMTESEVETHVDLTREIGVPVERYS